MAEGNHFDPDARGKDTKLPAEVDDTKQRASPVLALGRYTQPGAVRGKWVPLKVLADGTVVTTGGGGPVPTCPGIFVFCVGPIGSGNTYTTIQAAADAAKIAEGTYPGQEMLILVTPGYYPEDVTISGSRIGVLGLGGEWSARCWSITWTDATPASLATFNTSGNFADLSKDGAVNVIKAWVENMRLARSVAAPAWNGPAANSLRFLGSPVSNSNFLPGAGKVCDCHIDGDPNGIANLGGAVSCHARYMEIEDSQIAGMLSYQGANLTADDVRFRGDFWDRFDTTINKPGIPDAPFNMERCTIDQGLVLGGDVARVSLPFCFNRIGKLSVQTTSVLSVSDMEECFIAGSLTIANVGPTVNFLAGRHMQLAGGAGAAGFLPVVGFNS